MDSYNPLQLSVQHVSVCIEGKNILDQVNFSVKAGEFVGIIGSNGAGKSTLLRSIRGLMPVIHGAIRINGQGISSMSDRQLARIMAYMQQDVNLDFGFTALDVVLAGRYPYLAWWQGEGAREYEIAKKYMEFTGVLDLAAKSLQQISGGERQRILLAKVLAQETPLIMLDEPTASLDLVYQEEIFRYCRKVCDQGKTALIVAHDLKLAAKFCSRLLLLNHGNIVADGTPSEVITVKNLKKAYGLQAAVFNNRVTGSLDFHTYISDSEPSEQKCVHIIGGGATATGIIRALSEKNYKLSSGVYQEGDTDFDVATAFGVDCLVGPAFCAIDDGLGQLNRKKIINADWTMLSNLCYGPQNLDNLRAAFSARKLIIIEDTPLIERDFTGGEAAVLYNQLLVLPQTTVMTTTEFMSNITNSIQAIEVIDKI